jgi:hypothetical protein
MTGSKSINIVMRKVFAEGFYSQHAGLLLFSFAMLASYGLLINTLGTVRPDEVDYWQFFFALNMASNPVLVMVFCLLSLGYAIKACAYVAGQLDVAKHFFVRQATGGIGYGGQLLLWMKVFLRIMLPVFIFALYMVGVGLFFKNYLIPLLLLGYIAMLIMLSTVFIVRLVNRLADGHSHGLIFRLMNGAKPFHLLYLFQVIHEGKISLVMSKLLSCMLLIRVPMMMPTELADNKIYLLTGAIVAMAHIVLFYKERDFNDRYGAFVLNFPINLWARFLGPLTGYVLLMLPELGFMLGSFPLAGTIGALLLIFIMTSLFRSLLLLPSIGIKGFLALTFSAFFIVYMMIISELTVCALVLAALLSFLIYRRCFLNRSTLQG